MEGKRETSLEERQRQDAEKAADIRYRQIRLGHIPRPEPEPAPAPARTSKSKTKTSSSKRKTASSRKKTK